MKDSLASKRQSLGSLIMAFWKELKYRARDKQIGRRDRLHYGTMGFLGFWFSCNVFLIACLVSFPDFSISTGRLVLGISISIALLVIGMAAVIWIADE